MPSTSAASTPSLMGRPAAWRQSKTRFPLWSIPLLQVSLSSAAAVYTIEPRWPKSTSTTSSKTFGDVVAVDDVSLEIADGEFLVLVGPSGCGKSTLLRMIAGLEDVTSGGISIGGRDVTARAEGPRHRNGLPDLCALPAHERAPEPRATGSRRAARRRREIARRVDEVAVLLGLAELLDRRPAQLSGGQRQRVAMGRAIAREPQAFLLDEPLSNLDAKLRVGMRASLAQLHRRLGVTTVYVTHDQVEAMTLGQRVAVMRARADRPGRHAPAALRRAARRLRRRLHRLARDEPRRGDRRGRHRPLRPVHAAASARAPAVPTARCPRDPARGASRTAALAPGLADDRGLRRGARGARLRRARLLHRRRPADHAEALEAGRRRPRARRRLGGALFTARVDAGTAIRVGGARRARGRPATAPVLRSRDGLAA